MVEVIRTFYPDAADKSGSPAIFCALAQAVSQELSSDLKAEWDPNWKIRGVHSAYFGELSPTSNPEMPAILMEMAFHDHAVDAEQLKQPAFRYLAARAITRPRAAPVPITARLASSATTSAQGILSR